jgi:hypothetical protein
VNNVWGLILHPGCEIKIPGREMSPIWNQEKVSKKGVERVIIEKTGAIAKPEEGDMSKT